MIKEELVKKLRKAARLVWWIIPLGVCGNCTIFFAQVLYGASNEIASVEFGDGYKIRIWDEMKGIADPRWDPDHGYPSIYYEIKKSGNVVIPKTFLTTNPFDTPFNIRAVFAESGNLIALYDTKHWDFGVFVIFDIAHPERWPSFGSSSNTERQRWVDRYKQLKQENPDLPPYYH